MQVTTLSSATAALYKFCLSPEKPLKLKLEKDLMLSEFTIGMERQVTKDVFLLGSVHHKVFKSGLCCWPKAPQRLSSFLDSENTEVG